MNWNSQRRPRLPHGIPVKNRTSVGRWPKYVVKTVSHPAFALLNLERDQVDTAARGRKAWTYVQSAYKKPAKQKAAISIKNTNCDIMARNDNTIKLFFSVTKANLKDSPFVHQDSGHPHQHETYRGKSRHAMSARLSTPTALAQAPSNQNGNPYAMWCFNNKLCEPGWFTP